MSQQTAYDVLLSARVSVRVFVKADSEAHARMLAAEQWQRDCTAAFALLPNRRSYPAEFHGAYIVEIDIDYWELLTETYGEEQP